MSFQVHNNRNSMEELPGKDGSQSRTSKLFSPSFFLHCQISSYLSKHCDLVSCSATSHPVLMLSVRDSGVLKAFGCGSAGCGRERERERSLVRKAITCSLKEQMESFCASFPPFLLPSAYLNDMSSPNIQFLSWEFPPCSPLSAGLWACGCQKECVFSLLSSICLINFSVCVCLFPCRCLCGWVTEHQQHSLPVWLSSFLTPSDKNNRGKDRRSEEGKKGRSGKKEAREETWKLICRAPGI